MPASASLDAEASTIPLPRGDRDAAQTRATAERPHAVARFPRHPLSAAADLDSNALRHRPGGVLADGSDHGAWNSLLFESLVVALAAHTAHRLAVAQPEHASATADLRLHRVLSYIEVHPYRKLTLSELAAVACVSRYHLSHRFKQVMGMGPCRYTLLRRIERAKISLWRGDTPVAAIATELGFADQSRFAAIFRKETGLTPRQFRAASRLKGSWPAEVRR